MKTRTMCTTLIAAAALLLALASPAQQRLDEKRPATPTGLVTVSNLAGSVNVKGWDKPEVSVTGTLGKGSERLEFESSGDRTTIRVVLPKNAHNVDGSDLEIRVPAGSRLDVDTVSAEITASDLAGSLSLQTVSGEVSVTGSPKEVNAHSVSGSVRLDAQQSQKLRGKSVSGKVTVKAASPQDVQMESVSGDVRFEGGLAQGGSLEASTVSGDVEAALPAALAADFTLGTFSGGIENDFGSRDVGKPEDHTGRHVSFTTGAGGASVEVKTFSGAITLKKR